MRGYTYANGSGIEYRLNAESGMSQYLQPSLLSTQVLMQELEGALGCSSYFSSSGESGSKDHNSMQTAAGVVNHTILEQSVEQ